MELRDHIRMLAMHWFGVALILLITVAGAAAYTFTQPKVYEANSTGLVQTIGGASPALGSVTDIFARSRATTYVEIAESRGVAERAIEELGLDDSPASLVGRVDVSQPVDTALLRISARADSPQEAQQLADAWANAVAAEVAATEDPDDRQRAGTPYIDVYEEAALPSAPVSPRPELNLAIAGLVGLALGYGYALLRHTLDRRLRSPEVVQKRFEVPVIGAIPIASALGNKEGRSQVVLEDLDDPRQYESAEAFRKLRTNLVFMSVDNPPREIVVTSPQPGDGKSTVAANLAGAIAYSGQKVVLVDGDLRRPMVAESMQVDSGVGLTDVLVGRIGLGDALQQSAKSKDLFVLPAGRIPPNPSELLGSEAMRTMLAKLAEDYLVIVDAPPLLPVTDAAVLTRSVDGALIVISTGKTVDAELQQAIDNVTAVGGRPLGIIMNKASKRGMGYYQYYGYYGDAYYAQDAKGGRKRKRKAAKQAKVDAKKAKADAKQAKADAKRGSTTSHRAETEGAGTDA